MVNSEESALSPYEASCRKKVYVQTMKPASVHGIHFQTMGRYESSRKRLELLPEEALYLIERSTIECWTSEMKDAVPMSLQHAWSVMINAGVLSAERYQVSPELQSMNLIIILL